MEATLRIYNSSKDNS